MQANSLKRIGNRPVVDWARYSLAAFLTTIGSASTACAQNIASAEEAQSQEVSEADEGYIGGDIVVRAQRRDQRLQDVPIAVSVLGAASLERRDVNQLSDLTGIVPSLQVNGTFSSIPKITLRGIGTNDFVQNASAAVGTYLDEVYIGPAPAQNLAIFDIARIEVLRGPQGTLYGKNTTGGAVNYYSADPEGSVSGGVGITLGSYGRFDVQAHLNVPIDDRGGLRLSLSKRHRSGYWKNSVSGERDGNIIDLWAGRLKIVYDFTDRLRISASIFGGISEGDVPRRVPIGTFPGGGDVVGYIDRPGIDTGGSDRSNIDNVKSLGGMFKIETDIGNVTLASITGYGKVKRDTDQDADFSPNDLITNRYRSNQTYLSEEVQARGKSGRVDWVAGLHYYRERHDSGIDFAFFRCAAIGTCSPRIPIPVPIELDFDYLQVNRSYAAFTQGTFRLSERAALTGGLRYTYDERSFDGQSIPVSVAKIFPGYPRYVASRSWENVSWRLNAEYRLSQRLLVYGTAATGFRAGNWNGGAYQRFSQIETPVDPEDLLSFEVGAKSDWLNGRLRINVAAFHTRYENLQVATFRDGAVINDNAANASISGAELEATWRPSRHWLFEVGAAGLKTKYVDYISATGADLSGNKLINAPRLSGTALIEHRQEIAGNIELIVGGNVRYQSRVYFRPENDFMQGGYAIFGMRAGLEWSQHRASLSLFVKNLTDKRVLVDGSALGAPFFINSIIYNEPRTWGVSLSAEF